VQLSCRISMLLWFEFVLCDDDAEANNVNMLEGKRYRMLR